MWATLHTFEHNNLGGMTLIPAPKYGQTLLRSWARKHRSAITLLKMSPECFGLHIRSGCPCLHQMCQFQTTAPALPRESPRYSAGSASG